MVTSSHDGSGVVWDLRKAGLRRPHRPDGAQLPQGRTAGCISDDPSTIRELVAHAAGSSIEEDHHDHRD